MDEFPLSQNRSILEFERDFFLIAGTIQRILLWRRFAVSVCFYFARYFEPIHLGSPAGGSIRPRLPLVGAVVSGLVHATLQVEFACARRSINTPLQATLSKLLTFSVLRPTESRIGSDLAR